MCNKKSKWMPHIKIKEVRDGRSWLRVTAEYADIDELSEFLLEKYNAGQFHMVLRTREFCHDALIYWWNTAYDTMELLATDGYWSSIMDIWIHQRRYIRCVLTECIGFLKAKNLVYFL